jgi:hypothetical protein
VEIVTLDDSEDESERVFCGHCQKWFENFESLRTAHKSMTNFIVQIPENEQEKVWVEYYGQAENSKLYSIVSEDDVETVVNEKLLNC